MMSFKETGCPALGATKKPLGRFKQKALPRHVGAGALAFIVPH
jgi:hypothetical protein